MCFAARLEIWDCLYLKILPAHVANEQTDENNNHVEMYDSGGLDSFQEDWRYFYDCMLAPMGASQYALFKLKALAYNSPYKQPRLAPCTVSTFELVSRTYP